jgi:hypothetical protein
MFPFFSAFAGVLGPDSGVRAGTVRTPAAAADGSQKFHRKRRRREGLWGIYLDSKVFFPSLLLVKNPILRPLQRRG